jgi:hypothetical protein
MQTVFTLTGQNLNAKKGFWFDKPTTEVFRVCEHPLLAVFLNRAETENTFMFSGTGIAKSKKFSESLLNTFNNVKIERRVKLPDITLEQRVEFAIRCAMVIYEDKDWLKWANNWLNGTDRTLKSARKAAEESAPVPSFAGEAAFYAVKAASYLVKEPDMCDYAAARAIFLVEEELVERIRAADAKASEIAEEAPQLRSKLEEIWAFPLEEGKKAEKLLGAQKFVAIAENVCGWTDVQRKEYGL